ncbi:hypothetical protein GYMLUDRAFT_833963 [Collybiopsis luxurians FD-317 M1]|uniref:Uncharacterized protein n=1 Tax=Collybiopsis luxurians FD-317 M1 TaxID=944289 RepID=A0A0D0C048_9AGAR|nr:hypothetical protein GYMLUDRAFT_833963 [Collybiopsis luxurians FD-317 M1]
MDVDNLILPQLGYVLKNAIGRCIITFFFFGLYLGVSGLVVFLIVRNGLRKFPRQIALVLQLCLLFSSAIAFISTCVIALTVIRTILIQPDASVSLLERVLQLKIPGFYIAIFGWTGLISLMVGDALVIWRVWAVWRGNKLAQWMWMFLGICNTALLLLSGIRTSGVLASTVAQGDASSQSFQTALRDNFYLLFSLTLNALATFATAYKMSMITHATGQGYLSGPGESRAHRVLWFVVESGVVFCMIQAAYFAILISAYLSSSQSFSTSNTFGTFTEIVEPFASMLLPFYPSLIFIVSHLIGKEEE